MSALADLPCLQPLKRECRLASERGLGGWRVQTAMKKLEAPSEETGEKGVLFRIKAPLWTASAFRDEVGHMAMDREGRWAAEEDWLHPSAKVKKPENIDCDNAVDLLKNMVDEERHFELLLGVGLALAILVALGSSCFIVGLKVKPRAPSYWSNRTWSPFHNDFEAEVDVTMELRDTVQQLFDMTTKKETPTMKHHPP
ncbi:unnamed protein product [Effrenium voratum]|nr:unnamed protein product [Effrenium voratum]